VIALLQAAGFPVILMKGIARRAAGGHRLHQVRRTSDVDLLLPVEQIAAAYDHLVTSGYVRAFGDRAHSPTHHHLATLWNERRVGVELHSTLSGLADPSLVWQRTNASARTLEWQGLRVSVPSATELAWVTVVQAPSDTLTLGFRLRELLDFAVLLESGERLDWNAIDERLGLGEAADGDSNQPVPREVRSAWVSTARALSAPGEPDGQLDLLQLVRWRLRILARPRLRKGLKERLHGESARVMLELPPMPLPEWVKPPGYRWRLAGRASRVAFRLWRAMGSDAGGSVRPLL